MKMKFFMVSQLLSFINIYEISICTTHRPKGKLFNRRGKLLNLPLRGRGTAAAVEEGPYGRERFVADTRFLRTALAQNAPPQSGLRPASSTFYCIAATGSYFRLDSLRDAPPEGEAFCPQGKPLPQQPGQVCFHHFVPPGPVVVHVQAPVFKPGVDALAAAHLV